MGEMISTEKLIDAARQLSTAVDALHEADNLREVHGNLVAGLVSIQRAKEMRDVIRIPIVAATLLAGAGSAYEVAEGESKRMSDEDKLTGVSMALQKRLLLNDERGMHFCIFASKNGVTILYKEWGLRHKMELMGCTDIVTKATAQAVQVRPNNTAKADMIVDAYASCFYNGRKYEHDRSGDYAFKLPCYPTDGPDKHQGQAKRRVLSELWATISGESLPVEGTDVEPIEVASVVVQPKQIEAPAAPAVEAPPETQAQIWAKEWKHFAEANGSDHAALQIARRMREATSVDDLSAISLEADQLKTEKALDQRTYQKIGHYFGFRLDQLQG